MLQILCISIQKLDVVVPFLTSYLIKNIVSVQIFVHPLFSLQTRYHVEYALFRMCVQDAFKAQEVANIAQNIFIGFINVDRCQTQFYADVAHILCVSSQWIIKSAESGRPEKNINLLLYIYTLKCTLRKHKNTALFEVSTKIILKFGTTFYITSSGTLVVFCGVQ